MGKSSNERMIKSPGWDDHRQTEFWESMLLNVDSWSFMVNGNYIMVLCHFTKMKWKYVHIHLYRSLELEKVDDIHQYHKTTGSRGGPHLWGYSCDVILDRP